MSAAYHSTACFQIHRMSWFVMAWFLMHLMCREKASITVEADKNENWDSTITIHTWPEKPVLIFEDQALHDALTSGRSCWLATQSWANSNSRLAAGIWCNTSCTLSKERLKTPIMLYYFYRLPLAPRPESKQAARTGRQADLLSTWGPESLTWCQGPSEMFLGLDELAASCISQAGV